MYTATIVYSWTAYKQDPLCVCIDIEKRNWESCHILMLWEMIVKSWGDDAFKCGYWETGTNYWTISCERRIKESRSTCCWCLGETKKCLVNPDPLFEIPVKWNDDRYFCIDICIYFGFLLSSIFRDCFSFCKFIYLVWLFPPGVVVVGDFSRRCLPATSNVDESFRTRATLMFFF